jgi:hypothetical protein
MKEARELNVYDNENEKIDDKNIYSQAHHNRRRHQQLDTIVHERKKKKNEILSSIESNFVVLNWRIV